jgi:uncharacterized protein YwgA
MSKKIKDSELEGCIAPTFVMLRMEELVNRFKDLLQVQAEQGRIFFEIHKAFSDLYLELTDHDEKRKWIEKTIKKAEREAARLKLDLWFWRPEKDLDFQDQLKKRAVYLKTHNYRIDDIWDLLMEFAEDYAKVLVDDLTLSRVIEGVENACS